MTTSAPLKPGNQLWGICHVDREFARIVGDPLRTVVEAPNKLIAKEAAARFDFGHPCAHPITRKQIRHAHRLNQRRPGPRQELANKPSRGVRI